MFHCNVYTGKHNNSYLRERFPSAESETQDPVATSLQCACAKSMIPCERDARSCEVASPGHASTLQTKRGLLSGRTLRSATYYRTCYQVLNIGHCPLQECSEIHESMDSYQEIWYRWRISGHVGLSTTYHKKYVKLI